MVVDPVGVRGTFVVVSFMVFGGDILRYVSPFYFYQNICMTAMLIYINLEREIKHINLKREIKKGRLAND